MSFYVTIFLLSHFNVKYPQAPVFQKTQDTFSLGIIMMISRIARGLKINICYCSVNSNQDNNISLNKQSEMLLNQYCLFFNKLLLFVTPDLSINIMIDFLHSTRIYHSYNLNCISPSFRNYLKIQKLITYSLNWNQKNVIDF